MRRELKGIRVEKGEDLDEALKTTAFEHDGPVIVDVVTAKQRAFHASGN